VSALQERKKGDEERFYLMGMRYCTLVQHLGKKYGKNTVRDLLQDYERMIGYIEDLSKKLPKRYELESKKETPAIKAVLPQPVESATITKPVPVVPQSITEKRDGVNSATGKFYARLYRGLCIKLHRDSSFRVQVHPS